MYVGCGKQIKEGFIHADIRKLEHVDIVCPAWELSRHLKDVDYIYSRHMLEHLTYYEAYVTLIDWFITLKKGGKITIIVPDMDYHCKQWLRAEWSEDELQNQWSDARHSFAGFWGWQKECNPTKSDYNNTYWDVHKSGYNQKRMYQLLNKVGYQHIETRIEDKFHLFAEAQKLS